MHSVKVFGVAVAVAANFTSSSTAHIQYESNLIGRFKWVDGVGLQIMQITFQIQYKNIQMHNKNIKFRIWYFVLVNPIPYFRNVTFIQPPPRIRVHSSSSMEKLFKFQRIKVVLCIDIA